ncbi:MAG: penicillin acylase family protein [Calditrichaeota bacterium]|nr:MAG: penicillin acylase family protein [Calditrichota bacterium]
MQDLALDYEPHWQRIPVYMPEAEKPTSKAAALPSGQTAPQASTSFPNSSVRERDEMGNSVSPIASVGKPRKTFPESPRKPSSPGKPIAGTASAAGDFPGDLFNRLPIPIWGGSNSWVLGPQHTATGTVIFANDTHMRYSQPSPWFEAYLEYPGFRLYGYFMAGFPFALLGNNGFCAWGMTMCPMDDMDFFVERVNPRDSTQVWAVDHWESMQVREEIIRIKGKKPDTLQVRLTRHGPVINEVFPFIGEMEPQPVSVWWTLFQFPNRGLEAGYLLNHSRGLADTRRAAALIHAPGVNLMYGDREGNIAWWVAARLIRRPPGVRSKMFLDGASGKEDPRGFYDFSANPRAENPPWGYVFSANNQPDNPDGLLYPGYFAPENRARRIVQLLGRGKKWTVESMKRMSTDVTSAVFPELAQTILAALNTHPVLHRSDLHRQTAEILRRWDGDHQVDDLGPTVFYKLIYHVVHGAMGDELGEEPFRRILRTHLIKKTIPKLLVNEQSPWWDDVTTDSLETREEIFAAAFNRTVEELREQLGDDPREWKWGRVHTVEHPHPLGKRKPLDRLFNVGPFSVMGGEEVINPSGFVLTGEGRYRAVYGPATRIILDLGNPEHGVTINPTGESGVVVSPHYDDQAEMYNRGEFRPQLMSREELQSAGARRLVLRP